MSLTTRNKKLLVTKGKATIGAPGIATRSKDATRGSLEFSFGVASRPSCLDTTLVALYGVASRLDSSRQQKSIS